MHISSVLSFFPNGTHLYKSSYLTLILHLNNGEQISSIAHSGHLLPIHDKSVLFPLIKHLLAPVNINDHCNLGKLYRSFHCALFLSFFSFRLFQHFLFDVFLFLTCFSIYQRFFPAICLLSEGLLWQEPTQGLLWQGPTWSLVWQGHTQGHVCI